KARSDTSALLAPNQDVLFQHQLANVFESNRHFVQLALEFRGEFVYELGDGKSLRDIARELAHSRQVPHQQCEYLVRIDERSVAVDCANSVPIAIGAKSSVVLTRAHR